MDWKKKFYYLSGGGKENCGHEGDTKVCYRDKGSWKENIWRQKSWRWEESAQDKQKGIWGHHWCALLHGHTTCHRFHPHSNVSQGNFLYAFIYKPNVYFFFCLTSVTFVVELPRDFFIFK